MAREEQIIIDVAFNVGDTEEKLGSVTKKIEDLKEANKRLKNERKSDSADWASLTAQIKSNEQEIKSLQSAEKDLAGMISVADQQRRKYSDSFRGQAAQLADLKNQYASLSKAERESAGGQEMLQKLQQLDEQVKANDKSIGNFQRNVGNYPHVFDLSGTPITGAVRHTPSRSAVASLRLPETYRSSPSSPVSPSYPSRTPSRILFSGTWTRLSA